MEDPIWEFLDPQWEEGDKETPVDEGRKNEDKSCMPGVEGGLLVGFEGDQHCGHHAQQVRGQLEEAEQADQAFADAA